MAEDHDALPAQVALAWVLAQGPDVVPIPGTKRVEYLEQNVGALELALTEDEVARLDKLADRVAGPRDVEVEPDGVRGDEFDC